MKFLRQVNAEVKQKLTKTYGGTVDEHEADEDGLFRNTSPLLHAARRGQDEVFFLLAGAMEVIMFGENIDEGTFPIRTSCSICSTDFSCLVLGVQTPLTTALCGVDGMVRVAGRYQEAVMAHKPCPYKESLVAVGWTPLSSTLPFLEICTFSFCCRRAGLWAPK